MLRFNKSFINLQKLSPTLAESTQYTEQPCSGSSFKIFKLIFISKHLTEQLNIILRNITYKTICLISQFIAP